MVLGSALSFTSISVSSQKLMQRTMIKRKEGVCRTDIWNLIQSQNHLWSLAAALLSRRCYLQVTAAEISAAVSDVLAAESDRVQEDRLAHQAFISPH